MGKYRHLTIREAMLPKFQFTKQNTLPAMWRRNWTLGTGNQGQRGSRVGLRLSPTALFVTDCHTVAQTVLNLVMGTFLHWFLWSFDWPQSFLAHYIRHCETLKLILCFP